MEIKEIAIGGIDRHSPAQDAPNGVCEELINVRTDALGLHVYRDGAATSGDLDLTGIYLHRWGRRVWYVGINPQKRVVRFSLDGTTEQTLQWVSSAENVDIKSIGNMLVVSDKGADGKNPSLRTYVLEEADGTTQYKELDRSDLPLPGMSREDVLVKPFSQMGPVYRSTITPIDAEGDAPLRCPARSFFNFIQAVNETVDWVTFKQQMKDTLRAAFNRLTAVDKHLAHGYVLIGTSVTLYDGTETAFGNLMVVDLSPKTPYRDAGNLPTAWCVKRSPNHYTNILPQRDSLDGLLVNYVYDEGKAYWALMPDSGDLGGTSVTSSYFSEMKPKVTLAADYANLKDYVRSVNLWASKPYDKIDWDTYDLKMGQVNNSGIWTEKLPEAGDAINELLYSNNFHLYPFAHIRRLSECKADFHKQLLFKQKEWSVEEILSNGGSVDFQMEFGTSEGTLGDNLTVDAWNSKRAGDMFVYNNRIHMFDSCVKVDVPDSDLQSLSGWDDEWYVGQTASDTATGEYWHMKYAPDYMARSEPDGMRDITIQEACSLAWNDPGVLGFYHDNNPQASESADSYTWYNAGGSTVDMGWVQYVKNLYPRGGVGERKYMYLSMDKASLTKDTGRAKYMALHNRDSVGSHPENLPWYNVPVASSQEATARRYRECTVIAYLKAEGKTLTIRHENIPVLFQYTLSASGAATMGNVANLSGFLTYPDTRCERLVIQYKEGGTTYGWETPMRKEDSSYNFSYAYIAEGTAEFLQAVENTDATDSVYQESDIVNVSALNNPTVFPVTQSYRFVGSVTGMALALEELNSTQTGTYPVYVLTERGVFAMNQGTGGVLYAFITPINTDKCVKGKSVQVRNGVAYCANGRLYWLVGRKRTDILLPIDGDPDKAPRQNRSFPLACGGPLYDVTGLLSSVGIRTYLDGAGLAYDSFNDELLVSNQAYSYTWVFNFGAQRWFKISGSFQTTGDAQLLLKGVPLTLPEIPVQESDDSSGDSSDDSSEDTPSYTGPYVRILDMSAEDLSDKTIHIQTRPMKLTPMAFGVVERMIARVRATLTGTQNLSVYTFSSDNLENYVCSEAQQRANCTIDRIRLERTAHGRKYTVLVIGGKVPVTTELSTILLQVKANAPRKIR